jgi:formylglycine-generating enzyme required for sulfatase activity
VSIPDVFPARFVNWFQASVTLRNAGKRLPNNVEWHMAAHGTPEGGPCVTHRTLQQGPGPTGTAGWVSEVGAFDMVGNIDEMVAE